MIRVTLSHCQPESIQRSLHPIAKVTIQASLHLLDEWPSIGWMMASIARSIVARVCVAS